MAQFVSDNIFSFVLLLAIVGLGLLRYLNFVNRKKKGGDRWLHMLYHIWLTCEKDPAGQSTSFIENVTTHAVSRIWGSKNRVFRLFAFSFFSVLVVYISIFLFGVYIYYGFWNELQENYDESQAEYTEIRNRLLDPQNISFFEIWDGYNYGEHQALYIQRLETDFAIHTNGSI